MRQIIGFGLAVTAIVLSGCSGKSADDVSISDTAELAAGGATTTQRVTCTSSLFQHRDCPVDTQGGTIIDAQITQDESTPPYLCAQGNSHGFGPQSVWVDHGCSAEFQVTIQMPQHSRERITCQSNHGGYTTCPSSLDSIDSIRLVQQLSGAPCQLGNSFGYGQNYVWVDRGCRGVFDVTGWGGHGGPGGQDAVALYDQQGFNGARFSVNSAIDNFANVGFNDRTQSLIVSQGTWEACTDAGYNGFCQTFGPGSYGSLGPLSGQISSIRPR